MKQLIIEVDYVSISVQVWSRLSENLNILYAQDQCAILLLSNSGMNVIYWSALICPVLLDTYCCLYLCRHLFLCC